MNNISLIAGIVFTFFGILCVSSLSKDAKNDAKVSSDSLSIMFSGAFSGTCLIVNGIFALCVVACLFALITN